MCIVWKLLGLAFISFCFGIFQHGLRSIFLQEMEHKEDIFNGTDSEDESGDEVFHNISIGLLVRSEIAVGDPKSLFIY